MTTPATATTQTPRRFSGTVQALVGLWICALLLRAPIMLSLRAVAAIGACAKRAYDWADDYIPGPTLPKRKPNKVISETGH